MIELANDGLCRTEELSSTERKILGLLSRQGPLTHASLVQQTELAQQFISRIVAGLISRRLVTEGERVRVARRGYPSTQVLLDPDYCCSIGVAVNAQAVAVTIIDFAGTQRSGKDARFTSLPLQASMEWIEQTIESLLALDELGRRPVAGIGVSVAGSFIGPGKGFNTPRYLDEWAQIDIPRLFEQRFGLPCWADNNGNAAALAESVDFH